MDPPRALLRGSGAGESARGAVSAVASAAGAGDAVAAAAIPEVTISAQEPAFDTPEEPAPEMADEPAYSEADDSDQAAEFGFGEPQEPAPEPEPVPEGVTRILNLPRGFFSIEWWEGDMFLLEDPLFNFVSCTGQLRHDTWSPENVKRLAEGWGR